LRELVHRRGIRNDVSRYEAIGFCMIDMDPATMGNLLVDYPDQHSLLRFEQFFDTLYLRYDERFVTSAPDLAATTRRIEWAADSPALNTLQLDYVARIADHT
jgi:hypothetical protein